MSHSESSDRSTLSQCRCCLGPTKYFSTASILDFSASYSICLNCSSVQVDNPKWIEEAHSKAISNLDTGLVARCVSAGRMISTLLFLEGKKQSKGIDWGGGTGLLTRLLRDQGFDVQSYDKYASADHAEGFEANLEEAEDAATFVLSIECFEHLINPIDAFQSVTRKKDYFIFTTEIIDTPPPDPAKASWWYFLPESGQHITFASKKGLDEFCKVLGFENYKSFGSLHVMSRGKMKFVTRLVLGTKSIRGVALLIIPELLKNKLSLTIADKDEIMRRNSY